MKSLSVIAALAALYPASAFACSSCGCTLTADWLSQGLVAEPGTTIAVRYDYIPQTDLRTERRGIDNTQIPLPNDREIERYTYNHYVTVSLDHQFASAWGINVQLPFVRRPHATTAEGDTALSYSDTGGLGDARIVGRWQAPGRGSGITGVQFGVQLPTGRIHQAFESGPQAGELADRGIQAGFGVVQAIAGVYRYGRLANNFGYLAQLSGQLPLDRRDHYRPGAYGQASVGIDYTRWSGITPQLQLNFRVTGRDRGLNSDTENSGGEQLYIAPGVITKLGPRTSAFLYAQVPVYQRLGGYQLAPRATLSFGLQHRL